MNLPNKLTVLRVILVPFFVFFILADFIPKNDFVALAIFIIASLTDLLDGKIARKKGLVTNFGKFMDPIADKLLVVCALLCLLIVDEGKRMGPNQILGLIAVIIIVGREFIINGIRLVASDGGLVIAASMWGKIKTAVTMVSICLMIVVDEIPCLKEVSLVVFWVAVTLTVVSLVDYICKNASIMCDFNVVGDKKDAGKKDASNAVEAKQEFKPKFDEETGKPLS